MLKTGKFAAVALIACMAHGHAAIASEIKLFDVEPRVETEPAKSMEDAADDAEVWLNPTAADKSLIFGTDKKSGLFVFGLDGAKVDFFPVGRVNNVDLRSDFKTVAGPRVLIGASNRTKLGISFFVLDPLHSKLLKTTGHSSRQISPTLMAFACTAAQRPELCSPL